MFPSSDVDNIGGITSSPCIGITTSALPEVLAHDSAKNSNTGATTNSVHDPQPDNAPSSIPQNAVHWYALRLAYANDTNIRRVYDKILSDEHVKVNGFFPTLVTSRKENGSVIKQETCRLKNIFFIQGTFDQVKHFVYDNYNYRHLRFYSRHYHDSRKDEPIIVPDNQIRSLQIICNSNSEDILVINDSVRKFEKGQRVLIKEGEFAGVTGIVARFAGQQRVGIVIGSSMTVATAYIPKVFLEKC